MEINEYSPRGRIIQDTKKDEQWSGEERRGIQIHIINYINERLKEHTDKLAHAFESHTAEEMARYGAIDARLKAHCETVVMQARGSEERHSDTQERISSLAQSIESWMATQDEFAEAMKRAFPKDSETGRPDYDGHRTAHLAWITDSKESKEFKKYIRNVVLGAAAIAVTSWLTLLVWQGLLKGPQ